MGNLKLHWERYVREQSPVYDSGRRGEPGPALYSPIDLPDKEPARLGGDGAVITGLARGLASPLTK